MSKYGFKVPVSGQKIPHGWFAALVRFMKSLILSGDGRYTMVDRDENGTSVTLTPAVIDALNKASGGPSGPAAPAAPQHLTVDVSGDTATVGLSGSTQTAQFVGTGDVTISGNTNGQIEINSTGGGASLNIFPDYSSPVVVQGSVQMNNPYSFPFPVWLIGEVIATPDVNLQMRADLSINGVGSVFHAEGDFDSNSFLDRIGSFVSLLFAANTSFELRSATQDPDISQLAIYPCVGQSPSPLADYTVTRATGTTNGTLFYGLSEKGDNTVSVDSSLDGTPLDFEGASVL